MTLSAYDLMLVTAKIIVLDMDEIARIGHKDEIPVFFGMGQALNRVYSLLRRVPIQEVHKLRPADMMQWIREQPLPAGLVGKEDTLVDVMKKVILQ